MTWWWSKEENGFALTVWLGKWCCTVGASQASTFWCKLISSVVLEGADEVCWALLASSAFSGKRLFYVGQDALSASVSVHFKGWSSPKTCLWPWGNVTGLFSQTVDVHSILPYQVVTPQTYSSSCCLTDVTPSLTSLISSSVAGSYDLL